MAAAATAATAAAAVLEEVVAAVGGGLDEHTMHATVSMCTWAGARAAIARGSRAVCSP